MALNPKQEAFCLHYAKTGNATEAYKKAGYRVKDDNSAAASANRTLRNAKIQERLAELAEEIKTPKIMDIIEMQERLSAIGRRETFEDTVTPKGIIVRTRVKETDAIKAITQLAKMQGVAENVNLNISIPVIEGDAELED